MILHLLQLGKWMILQLLWLRCWIVLHLFQLGHQNWTMVVGPVDQIWLLGNGIQIMMVDLVDLVFGDAVPEGVVQISIWVKITLQMHSKMSSPKNLQS